jgi:hypothetical protein
MSPARRTLSIGACIVAVAIAAACGGGQPSSPSPAEGSTIAGTVRLDGGSAAGMTVAVGGTNLSTVVESGYFKVAGVPPGTVRLQFRDSGVNAAVEVPNVGQQRFIELELQVSGASAVILNEFRSNDKVALCHRTDSGAYHMIDVSVNAEPAHRAHGDGKPGDPVPGRPLNVFDQSCGVTGPSVSIEKTTNGEEADDAPGPTIAVGSPVTWRYIVTNTGTVPLTNVVVADNRNVTVTCPGTALAVGQSITCTGTGVATAGQYVNIGTVTAASGSTTVTGSDSSHYFGQAPGTTENGPKVELCHRTGNGTYHLIDVSVDAEPAHRAHGDAKIGEAVPGQTGKVFGPSCAVTP